MHHPNDLSGACYGLRAPALLVLQSSGLRSLNRQKLPRPTHPRQGSECARGEPGLGVPKGDALRVHVRKTLTGRTSTTIFVLRTSAPARARPQSPGAGTASAPARARSAPARAQPQPQAVRHLIWGRRRPGTQPPFGAHPEARGAREGSPVWAGADVRAKKYLAVTGLREPPGRPPPGRPQPGRQAFDLGVPSPRHADPFGARPKARGAREGSPVWVHTGLAFILL